MRVVPVGVPILDPCRARRCLLDGHAKHYAKLSGRKRIGYADYVKLGLSDEERFVQPEFVPNFLRAFLSRPTYLSFGCTCAPFVHGLGGIYADTRGMHANFGT